MEGTIKTNGLSGDLSTNISNNNLLPSDISTQHHKSKTIQLQWHHHQHRWIPLTNLATWWVYPSNKHWVITPSSSLSSSSNIKSLSPTRPTQFLEIRNQILINPPIMSVAMIRHGQLNQVKILKILNWPKANKLISVKFSNKMKYYPPKPENCLLINYFNYCNF